MGRRRSNPVTELRTHFGSVRELASTGRAAIQTIYNAEAAGTLTVGPAAYRAAFTMHEGDPAATLEHLRRLFGLDDQWAPH